MKGDVLVMVIQHKKRREDDLFWRRRGLFGACYQTQLMGHSPKEVLMVLFESVHTSMRHLSLEGVTEREKNTPLW